MCLESVTSYATCTAKFIHTVICREHIAHTHRQLDKDPCPKHRCRELVVRNDYCSCGMYGVPCKRREEWKSVRQVWTFEQEDVAMNEDREEIGESGG